MKYFKIILLLLIFSFAVSCMNSANKALLVGEWKGADWLVNGQPSNNDASLVTFRFDKDGGYNSDFGGSKEKGTYILREDKLYTTAVDQMEIMVQIAKLTKDSLVFDMNRSGQAETLIMVKK